MDMEFVQFIHRDDLAAVGPGDLVTEGVRGEGGVLLTARASASSSRHPRTTEPDRRHGRGRFATPGRQRTPAVSELSPATTSPAASSRDQGGRAARTARVPRHQLAEARLPNAREQSRRSSQHVPQFSSWRHRHHRAADGSGATTTNDGRGARAPRRRCPPCPACSRRASARGIARRNRWGQFASDLWCSGSARSGSGAVRQGDRATSIDEAEVEAAARQALLPFEERDGDGKGRRAVPGEQDLQKTMQDLVGIVRTESEMAHALDALSLFRSERAHPHRRQPRYNPAGTRARLRNLLTVSRRSPAPPWSARRAAARISAMIPGQGSRGGRST